MSQITQAWELPVAGRLETNDNVSWSEAAKFSDYRVEVLDKILKNFKQQEKEFVEKEGQFVNDSNGFLETFDRYNQEFIRVEEENVKNVQDEINRYRPEQEKFQDLLSDTRIQIKEAEERIASATEQERSLATQRENLINGINPTELGNLKFKDPNDPYNDIFKWVYESVYKGSRVDYSWKAFKTEAFKKGKEAEFLGRLRSLPIGTLKKADFDFGRTVYDRKTENLAALEVKNKQNASLRNLIDYIGNVVESGSFITQIDGDKIILEERNKELERRQFEGEQINRKVQLLKEKIQYSNHYITTLRGLRPYFSTVSTGLKERLDFQNDYVNTLHGNPDALDNLAERTSQRSPADPSKAFYQAQTSGTRVGEIEEVRQQEYESVKEQRVASQGEEQFEGEKGQTSHASKKAESKYPVPATDLKESPFATSSKGSCETCSIF